MKTNQTRPIIKHRSDIAEFLAGDRCTIRELFSPANDRIETNFSLAYAYVEPGGRTLDHLLHQAEIYYVIAGTGTMFLDGVAYAVHTGSSFYVPPHCRQWLRNDGPERFEFLCIVDPPWTPDGEEILE